MRRGGALNTKGDLKATLKHYALGIRIDKWLDRQNSQPKRDPKHFNTQQFIKEPMEEDLDYSKNDGKFSYL